MKAFNQVLKFLQVLKFSCQLHKDGCIPDTNTAVIVSKIVKTFTWENVGTAVRYLLKDCKVEHITNVIHCCNLMDYLRKDEAFEILFTILD